MAIHIFHDGQLAVLRSDKEIPSSLALLERKVVKVRVEKQIGPTSCQCGQDPGKPALHSHKCFGIRRHPQLIVVGGTAFSGYWLVPKESGA